MDDERCQLHHQKRRRPTPVSSSCDSADVLPFYPSCQSELVCQDKLRVTWFEADFCQSRYAYEDDRLAGSNACTVIAVLLAARCHKGKVPIHGPALTPGQDLIKAIGLSMLHGNEIHNFGKNRGMMQSLNLNIPEAIKVAGRKASRIKEWVRLYPRFVRRSVVYMQPLLKTLHKNLIAGLDDWRLTVHSKKHADLYVILVSDSRSSLFIFKEENGEKIVTLVDTHQHSCDKGLCVSTVEEENLRCLCAWLSHINDTYYRSLPALYELSFLYFKTGRKKTT